MGRPAVAVFYAVLKGCRLASWRSCRRCYCVTKCFLHLHKKKKMNRRCGAWNYKDRTFHRCRFYVALHCVFSFASCRGPNLLSSTPPLVHTGYGRGSVGSWRISLLRGCSAGCFAALSALLFCRGLVKPCHMARHGKERNGVRHRSGVYVVFHQE